MFCLFSVDGQRFSKTSIDMGDVDVIRVPHGLKENGFKGVILVRSVKQIANGPKFPWIDD